MTAPVVLPADIALVIFDADGTLRRTTVPDQPCPRTDTQWELFPDVRPALAHIDWTRVHCGIASNQDQVGYGHLSAGTAYRLLAAALRAATGRPPRPGAVRFCPHVLEVDCPHRKPASGMLLAIMRTFATPPAQTLFVGDTDGDRLAAARAGVRFVAAHDCFARRAGQPLRVR